MAKGITNNMECINPHAELPWHRSEYDYNIHDHIHLYIPENRAGTSVKTEWAEDHANLYNEYKGDSEVMFVYTDGSLSYNNGTHRTGYGIVVYRNGMEIASVKGSMGEHVEVYDTKMRALEAAAELIHKLINSETSTLPLKIIITTDNTGALQWIFRGSPGKAQGSSIAFCKHVLDILDQHENTQFALTCPGHFDIEGNKQADHLAKSSSWSQHKKSDYKSLSYIGSLHKCEIGEEWTHRWTNQPSTLCSNFHITNHIPPSTKPTTRFTRMDHCTFSWTLQCCTGHAHIGEYYCQFILSENQKCHCSDTLQT